MLRVIEDDFNKRWDNKEEVPGWIEGPKQEPVGRRPTITAVDSLDDDEPAPALSAPVPLPPSAAETAETTAVKMEEVDSAEKPFRCDVCDQGFAKARCACACVWPGLVM
jgi:hypothetical protein